MTHVINDGFGLQCAEHELKNRKNGFDLLFKTELVTIIKKIKNPSIDSI